MPYSRAAVLAITDLMARLKRFDLWSDWRSFENVKPLPSKMASPLSVSYVFLALDGVNGLMSKFSSVAIGNS